MSWKAQQPPQSWENMFFHAQKACTEGKDSHQSWENMPNASTAAMTNSDIAAACRAHAKGTLYSTNETLIYKRHCGVVKRRYGAQRAPLEPPGELVVGWHLTRLDDAIGSSPFWHLLMWPMINTAGFYRGSTTTFTQPLNDTQCMVYVYVFNPSFTQKSLGGTQLRKTKSTKWVGEPHQIPHPPEFLGYTPPEICLVGDLLTSTTLNHDSTTIWEDLFFAFSKHQTSKSKL